MNTFQVVINIIKKRNQTNGKGEVGTSFFDVMVETKSPWWSDFFQQSWQMWKWEPCVDLGEYSEQREEDEAQMWVCA